MHEEEIAGIVYLLSSVNEDWTSFINLYMYYFIRYLVL
jgi:hypothetical protein